MTHVRCVFMKSNPGEPPPMMMMSSSQDDALVQEFITEGLEHLGDIEPDLLKMEQQAPQVDTETINRIFRAIHSIKGASGFFGFERLKNLSHVMESVLMRVRDGQLVPEPYMMEPLLVGVDRLREMLEDIDNSESIDTLALEAELHHYTQNSAPYEGADSTANNVPATTAVAVAKESETPAISYYFEVDEKAIQRALNIGQFVYVAQLVTDEDLHANNRGYDELLKSVASIGTVLSSTIKDEEREVPPPVFQILFATVLELDLVPGALEVPESRLSKYNSEIKSNTGELVDMLKAHEINIVGLQLDAKNRATDASASTGASGEAQAAGAKATPEKGKGADENNDTIRVRVNLLNKLMDFAGELVLSRNQLIRATHQEVASSNDRKGNEALSQVVQSLNTTTSQLQEHIMQTRMQPIESVFRRFPRVVRDLSNQLGKKIQLEMIGQDVELDKTILESLSDPLTHMIRNCCDHGIETPDIREAAGKKGTGKIVLHAYHEGGQINLAIIDDGNGIDTSRVGAKAIKNGILTQEQFDAMSHQERLNLIFHAGLSTAEKVSDVSGRGVGMDVVRSNIENLGGHIYLESELGKGSRITLQLPLTLAIIPSLVVGLGNQRFCIPQINLKELVRIRASEVHQKIERIGRAPVLRLRGRWLPLLKLQDVLRSQETNFTLASGHEDRRATIEDARYNDPVQVEQMPEARRNRLDSDYNILVLGTGNNQYGLIVDQVFDTEEIVVKPLSHYIKESKCFSGTSIMGDGKVAMICDVSGIAIHSQLDFTEVEAEQTRRKLLQQERHAANTHQHGEPEYDENGELIYNDGETQSVILFSNHAEEQFALPLHDLLRLERINLADVELVGNREFISYRGVSLPLIRLEDYLSVRPCEPGTQSGFMIIPKYGDGMAGIFATQILDTIETSVELNTQLMNATEVSGSAVINDHLTIFVNAEALLNSAGVWVQPRMREAAGV
jgi:two-component system, chemotaxis family, sensor kinase CheA